MTTVNTHLKKYGEFLLDDRMNDETRMFVKNFLKVTTASQLIKLPLEFQRNGKHDEELKIIKNLKFENLNAPKEISIKNPTDGYDIPVKVFTPNDSKKDAPIIIFFHGGSWSLGHTQSHYYPIASLASASKMIWISVEYRLAPEHKYKTQLTDYKASFEYVEANRDLFSSKDAKIGVAGDSAGAHIAALLAQIYRTRISFQVLVYPSLDFANHYPSIDEFSADCYLITPEIVKWGISNYLENPSMATNGEVSPIFSNNFTNLPQCLIVAVELDSLIDENRAYHEKVLQGNNRSEFKLIKGTIHGLFVLGHIMKSSWTEMQNCIVDFLNSV